MRPGVIAATAAEACILVKGHITPGKPVCFSDDGMLTLSGIGAASAYYAARSLLENGATGLISWGFAGGLTPEFSPGSLILPEQILAPDQSVYNVDPLWHGQLYSRLESSMKIHTGTLAESTVVLSNSTEKKAFFRQTGAAAVDMESASIARAAKEAGVPFAVIRAIIDSVETLIPRSVLNSIDQSGRVRPLRLLSGIVRNPSEWIASFKMGRNFLAARATLATVARQMGESRLWPSDENGCASPVNNQIPKRNPA
jgi:adenosylhomocysteine nucleosidase